MSTARQVVVAFAVTQAVGWIVGLALYGIPHPWFALAGFAFNVLVVVALWTLWRPA